MLFAKNIIVFPFLSMVKCKWYISHPEIGRKLKLMVASYNTFGEIFNPYQWFFVYYVPPYYYRSKSSNVILKNIFLDLK